MKSKNSLQNKSITNHSQYSQQITSQNKGQQSFSPSQNQLIQKMLNINNGIGNTSESYSKTFKNSINNSQHAFSNLFDHHLKNSKEAQNQLNFNNCKMLEKLNSSTRERSMTSRHCNQSLFQNTQFSKLNNTEQSQLNIEEQLQTLEQYQKQQKIIQENTKNNVLDDDEVLNETGDFGQQPQNSEIIQDCSNDQSFQLKKNSENQEDSTLKNGNNESLYSLQPSKDISQVNASISSNHMQYNSQNASSNQSSLGKISKHSQDEIEEISVQDLDKLEELPDTQQKPVFYNLQQVKQKNPKLDINKFKKPVQNEITQSLDKIDYKKQCDNNIEKELKVVKAENLLLQEKLEKQQKAITHLTGQNLIQKKKLQSIQEGKQKIEIELNNKYQQQINQLNEKIKNLEIMKTQELSSLQKLVNDTMIKNQILLQEKLDHQKCKKKLENKISTLEKYIESIEEDQSFNEQTCSTHKMHSFIENLTKNTNQKQSFSQNFKNFLQCNSPSQSVSPSRISQQPKDIKAMTSLSPLFHKSLIQEDFNKSQLDYSKINKQILMEKLKQYQKLQKKREKKKVSQSNQPPSFGASPSNNNQNNVTNKFVSINNEFFNQNYYVNHIQIDTEGKEQSNSVNLSLIQQYKANKIGSGIKSDRSKEKLLKTAHLLQPQSGNITLRQNSVNSQLKIS